MQEENEYSKNFIYLFIYSCWVSILSRYINQAICLTLLVICFIFIHTHDSLAREIHDAVNRGNLENLKNILQKNPMLINARNEHGKTPLHSAASHKFSNEIKQIIKFLVEQGADINARDNNGRTPLHEAVFDDHVEIERILLKMGAHR